MRVYYRFYIRSLLPSKALLTSACHLPFPPNWDVSASPYLLPLASRLINRTIVFSSTVFKKDITLHIVHEINISCPLPSGYSHTLAHYILTMIVDTYFQHPDTPVFGDKVIHILRRKISFSQSLMEGHKILISQQLSARPYLMRPVSLLIIFLGLVSFVCPHRDACNLLHY